MVWRIIHGGVSLLCVKRVGVGSRGGGRRRRGVLGAVAAGVSLSPSRTRPYASVRADTGNPRCPGSAAHSEYGLIRRLPGSKPEVARINCWPKWVGENPRLQRVGRAAELAVPWVLRRSLLDLKGRHGHWMSYETFYWTPAHGTGRRYTPIHGRIRELPIQGHSGTCECTPLHGVGSVHDPQVLSPSRRGYRPSALGAAPGALGCRVLRIAPRRQY